jgi:hypothetical protein
VAESLTKLVKVIIDRPVPGVATAKKPKKPNDAAEAALIADDLQAQQRTNEIFFEAEVKEYLASVKLLNSNMKKAYALIHDVYCTKSMQHRIDDAILADSSITNDPIKLLETIRDLMHETTRTKLPLASWVETAQNMITIAQRESESMAEYHKRFKEHKDMFMQTMGSCAKPHVLPVDQGSSPRQVWLTLRQPQCPVLTREQSVAQDPRSCGRSSVRAQARCQVA